MGKASTVKDIYDLLDQVRRRPGMFFGRPGSLDLLGAFLSGMAMPPLKPEEPSFSDFNAWLAARIDELPDSHNMVQRWLEEEFGPEKAFDVYFRYLDEFRKNVTDLLYVNTGPVTPKGTHGDGSVPRVPGRLVVGRFSPSDIYFWGSRTGLTLEKHFPFCHSAAKAKRLALEWWEAPPRTWKKLNMPERLKAPQSKGLWGLLEQVRLRPGMYCDPGNKPLTTLETMLWGYSAALADHHVPDDGGDFNEAFRAYLDVRFGWSLACGWAFAIRDHLGTTEDELTKFFVLIDEFKSVVDRVPESLSTVTERLRAISLRCAVSRRRRRRRSPDWVVNQLGKN